MTEDDSACGSTFGGSSLGQTASIPATPSRDNTASADGSPLKRRTYVSLKQVCEKLGVSERTAHKITAQDWFPLPLELRPRLHRWVEEEIDAALAARAPRRLERAPEPERLARGRAARQQEAA